MADESRKMSGPPTPGPQHEKLKPFEGRFRATVRIWMGPGDPSVSTGTMLNTFQLGGLYLHQDYVGDRMEGPVSNFQGKGYWGYNTTTGKYEGFWIDNASTMMQVETGNLDPSGTVWTMFSEIPNPATGQPMKRRTLITLVDNNRHRMESYFSDPSGAEFKAMEIEYQRAE